MSEPGSKGSERMSEPRETETQRIFDILKARILQNEIPAGMPLSHSQLCRDLQTSRTPVREALSRLEGLGLVTTIPHRGTIVAKLDLHDYLEIGQILAQLEPFAARMAAGHILPATLDAFEAQLRELHHATPTAALIERLNQIDNAIHREIMAKAGNRRMYDMVETMRSLCDHLSFALERRFDTVIDELFALIAALRAGNSAEAAHTMLHHITSFGETLPGSLRR